MTKEIDESATDAPQMIDGNSSTELASNRTAMAFDRTGMASDRTLMAVIRTSLSLIAFGFTIFQFFSKISSTVVEGGLPAEAPRRFGLALIALGIMILVSGILDHWRQTKQLNARRTRLFKFGIMHNLAPIKVSTAMAVALLLLVVGLLAVARILFHFGPF